MKQTTIFNILFSAMISFTFMACTKSFLDKKPDSSLIVPSTLADFQALLDRPTDIMNIAPSINEIAADDFYRLPNTISSLSTVNLNSYLWAANVYQGLSVDDWNKPYQQIFYANVVLDGLSDIKTDASNQAEWNRIKGIALFYRAIAFYHLAQVFSAPYDKATANQLPGIPIRLSSDVNQIVQRGTIQQTYQQIITDLNEAEILLPLTSAYKSRPNKIAVYGLKGRMYQTTEDYVQAQSYANLYLQNSNTLINYNSLSTTAARPFPSALPNGNNELVYDVMLLSYPFFTATTTLADTTLYQSYNSNDLRKSLFFNKVSTGYTFKGSYTGTTSFFGGLANDEMYLIRSECKARNGDVDGAMSDLNSLLTTRWKTGTFIKFAASSVDDALKIILSERRKELIGRGTRWTDLRRLNKDSRFAVTLTRNINGQLYKLSPNDNKYVFPIPDNEISGSELTQNPR